ncbi:MAG: serine/threonine protein kinase, partial [Deltaproteobacteria bacterium]|nr:serine/threonine protein kinase [Deltaproteobacteria bacterium]
MDGQMIGQYRVEAKLGEGGVGEVFKAVDTVLGRAVAIKRLRPEMTSREELVDRFHEEARTLAQLHHPNIAILYGVERDDDCLLMVMEYVEGESISELLRRQGALPVALALPVFFQALDGIGYVHARGVVHRDIKGSNLMLGRDGLLKVMDFGIARVLGSERSTLVGQMVGTPEYMPPEQIRGEATDARSDIYSLGILLFAMLSGRTPFDAKGGYAQIRAQVEEEPLALSSLALELPPELCDVVMHALAKDPGERYQSVEAFRAALIPFARSPDREGDTGVRGAASVVPEGAVETPGVVTEPTRVLVEARSSDPDLHSDPGGELDSDLRLREQLDADLGGNSIEHDAPTLRCGVRAGGEHSAS